MSLCTEIHCDGCGAGLHYSGCIGKTHIQRWARKDGWSIGNHDLCPKCRKKRSQLKSDYLIFRFENEDETFDYLTTRHALSHVLEVNQENDIPWQTVDAVIEDYESNKSVGAELYDWFSTDDILDKRDLNVIKRLKFYTHDTRNSAKES